jgi:hypothetical protein
MLGPQTSDDVLLRVQRFDPNGPVALPATLYTLYDDGHLVSRAPDQGALPTFRVRNLTPAGVSKVMDVVEASALVPADAAPAAVGTAPQALPSAGTTIVLRRQATTVARTVPPAATDPASAPRLARLLAALADVETLVGSTDVSDSRLVPPDRIGLAAVPRPPADEDPDPIWPASVALASLPAPPSCLELPRSQAQVAAAVLAAAGPTTTWRQFDARYRVSVRLLLPDQDCTTSL